MLVFVDCLLLAYSGAWVGCTLSCGWCQGQGSILFATPAPTSEIIRRAVAIVLVAPAAVLNCWSARERYKMQASGVAIGAWAFLSCTASLCCLTCALVPMSCAALRETDWKYVGWNDYVHDGSLAFLLLCQLFAFLAQWAGQIASRAVPQPPVLRTPSPPGAASPAWGLSRAAAADRFGRA